ncbi:hypothetical protein ABZ946_31435 [Streptomyces sp. NPDC046324]|uniref:hypothetical protein n=1 Tax=Streptomyces sp. NPDC046324 TaxID=3154915 RepID=UPI0033D342F0
MSFVTRRLAPALLLLEAAYLVLMEVAFSVLPPDTGELDHTESAALGGAAALLLVAAVTVALVGAAALLALGSVRERAPRSLVVGWTAVVALGQLAIAGKALANAVAQDPGPDTVIGALMAAVALCVAAACGAAARTAFRPAPRTAGAA